MKKIYLFTVFIFLFNFMPATADEIKMKLSSTCGLDTKYIEVEIWNPSGGYAQVASDRSVKVNVPTGHKLIPLVGPKYCDEKCESSYKTCIIECEKPGHVKCDDCEKKLSTCPIQCFQSTSKKLTGSWTEAKDGGILKVMCHH